MRVLKWIIGLVHGSAGAKETPIGWIPQYADIDWNCLEYPTGEVDDLQAVDRAAWRSEVIGYEQLLIDLHDHFPPEVIYQSELLICRL
jgi:phosphoenolpyruvate carboxykinase (GTP)